MFEWLHSGFDDDRDETPWKIVENDLERQVHLRALQQCLATTSTQTSDARSSNRAVSPTECPHLRSVQAISHGRGVYAHVI